MLELEHSYRVVDVHTRINPPGTSTDEMGYSISPDRLEREMHQAGIVRAVVFPPTISEFGRGYLAANNAVARYSVDRPFVAFARLNGPIDPGTNPLTKLQNLRAKPRPHHTNASDVEQYAYDDRFFGFKLNPPRDGLPHEPVLDEIAEVDQPVIVHAGREFPPAAVAKVFLERDITTILCHFGGYPHDIELMNTAIDLLDSYERCFLETSFVRSRGAIERALLEHPDRVLFGSGAPTVHPNVGVMEILTLNVSEDKLRRAFSGNATRVIPALGPT